jgi:hypothetical protein
VGRFEEFSESLKEIEHQIEVALSIEHVNKSNRDSDFRKYYTDETAEIALRRYAIDIELFDYTYSE